MYIAIHAMRMCNIILVRQATRNPCNSYILCLLSACNLCMRSYSRYRIRISLVGKRMHANFLSEGYPPSCSDRTAITKWLFVRDRMRIHAGYSSV